jgi:hypothetical protein
MADKKFPYTTVPNNLRSLLKKIPTIGSPPKASQKWLESIGFTGGNNKSLLPVLRQIGVIKTAGEPTEYWTALRAGDKPKFAEAIRNAYADLFAVYEDAHKQDNDALLVFFRTHTDLGDKALSFCVRTFKVLTEFGDFEAETPSKSEAHEAAEANAEERAALDAAAARERPATATNTRPVPAQGPQPVALTVNLQIQLPPSAEGEVYDKLFAAMGKHLRGLISPSE